MGLAPTHSDWAPPCSARSRSSIALLGGGRSVRSIVPACTLGRSLKKRRAVADERCCSRRIGQVGCAPSRRISRRARKIPCSTRRVRTCTWKIGHRMAEQIVLRSQDVWFAIAASGRGTPTRLAPRPPSGDQLRVSPNREWVAFESTESAKLRCTWQRFRTFWKGGNLLDGGHAT